MNSSKHHHPVTQLTLSGWQILAFHPGLLLPSSVSLLLTINGAGILGRLTSAYFANEYFGQLNLRIPLALVSGMLMYCWAAIHNTAGIYAFAVFYGVASTGLQ